LKEVCFTNRRIVHSPKVHGFGRSIAEEDFGVSLDLKNKFIEQIHVICFHLRYAYILAQQTNQAKKLGVFALIAICVVNQRLIAITNCM